ncbi:MAG: GHKL domain-containing protein [Lachnospiraceae bacterium]|nr:GHKL domain-containing protein [Lachnospiraceae bacterium]
MRDILLILLYISIFSLFAEAVLVFRNIRTRLDSCLFLSCIALLINNAGYLMELRSKTEEAYITALQLSYLGRVWITFPFLLFTAELCRVTIPRFIRDILIIIHLAVYGTVLTIGENDLFYRDMVFSTDGLFPVLHHGNGPVHHLFMQMQLLMLFCALYWLFRTFRKEKGQTEKKRVMTIFIAFLLQGILLVTQICHLIGITNSFDINIFGNVILTIFLFVAIFRYNLLGVADIAREFVIDRLSEGVIAVDNEGEVQYFNEPMKLFYPSLPGDPKGVMSEVRDACIRGSTITLNDRIYKVEENELVNNGESLGKLYALVDVTSLKQNEYKLISDAAILEMAAKAMKERLLTAEEMVQQDRAMRHDRRHFEALLLSLLEDGKTDEVKKCLEERLAQEPRSAARFCENATVNAAVSHYVSIAERKNIRVDVSMNVPFDPGTDEMQLAIAISNLLENAVHGCEELPEQERFIEISAKYKGQLLLEVANSCAAKVNLDEEGHPYTSEAGHGVGTRSVLAFVEQTGSEIRYIAEDRLFKVRMIIN